MVTSCSSLQPLIFPLWIFYPCVSLLLLLVNRYCAPIKQSNNLWPRPLLCWNHCSCCLSRAQKLSRRSAPSNNTHTQLLMEKNRLNFCQLPVSPSIKWICRGRQESQRAFHAVRTPLSSDGLSVMELHGPTVKQHYSFVLIGHQKHKLVAGRVSTITSIFVHQRSLTYW